MVQYQWDDSLATGHKMIDEQHKQLFVALNDLLQACQEHKGSEALTKSLNFLNDYTIKHFFDEEQVQQKYGYPDYPNHKNLHDAFKKTVRDLKVKLIMQGPSEALIDEVKTKIGGWLVTHIKGNDIKIAAFIKGKNLAAG
jgi:hemerythrin-like metal-binding protein